MQENEPLSPEPIEQNKKSQSLALGILVFCVVAAIGNWVYGVRPKEHPKQEHTSSSFGSMFEDKAEIAVIVVEGTIVHDASGGGGFSGPNNGSADRIVKAIRDAEKDGVKGILFKINSPGGSAAASQSVIMKCSACAKKASRSMPPWVTWQLRAVIISPAPLRKSMPTRRH